MMGLLLISGGIDSPVAGFIMHKNGLEIAAVHFVNSIGGIASKKAVELVKRLRESTGQKVPLFTVVLAPSQLLFSKSCNRRFQCLLCKRMMYRFAEKIAQKNGYDVLITGESIGQVASQTIENMGVISTAVRITVLRPLLAFDKQDTVALARSIGTFEISKQSGDSCPFVPIHPMTRASLKEVEHEEERVDLDSLISEMLKTVTMDA